jgi:hypothetical protein
MRRSATFHQPDYDASDRERDVVAQIRETDPFFVLRKAAALGRVSTDTGAILIVDPVYLMSDDDHAAGRTPASLASGYDAATSRRGATDRSPLSSNTTKMGSPRRSASTFVRRTARRHSRTVAQARDVRRVSPESRANVAITRTADASRGVGRVVSDVSVLCPPAAAK